MPKKSGYQTPALVFGVLVILYFLCPFVYIWPVFAIYGKHRQPPAWVERAFDKVFYPIGYLERHLPGYRELLAKEAYWFGLGE